MRLEVESPPDAVDRRRREAGGFRHRAQAPVRRLAAAPRASGERPRRPRHRRCGAARRDGARHKDPPSDVRPTAPPFSNRVGGCAQPQADVLVCHPCRRVQDDAPPLRQPLRGLATATKALKFAPLAVGQIDPTAVLPIAILRANARRESYKYLSIRTLSCSPFQVAGAKMRCSRASVSEWPRLSRAGGTIIKTTVDHALMRGLATAGPVMRRGASSV